MSKMNNTERRRLLKLDNTSDDEATGAAIHKMLYDDPATYWATIRVQIRDPLLELTDLLTKGTATAPPESAMNKLISEQMLDDLPSEWYEAGQGASWWVNAYQARDPATSIFEYLPIGDGGHPGPPLQAGTGDGKLTFANIEEALRWAVSYIDANQDDIRELLDDPT